MGKCAKLRCLFGINRERSSTRASDEKIPGPKKLEKPLTTPNEYVKDGNRKGVMGSDRNPDKIEIQAQNIFKTEKVTQINTGVTGRTMPQNKTISSSEIDTESAKTSSSESRHNSAPKLEKIVPKKGYSLEKSRLISHDSSTAVQKYEETVPLTKQPPEKVTENPSGHKKFPQKVLPQSRQTHLYQNTNCNGTFFSENGTSGLRTQRRSSSSSSDTPVFCELIQQGDFSISGQRQSYDHWSTDPEPQKEWGWINSNQPQRNFDFFIPTPSSDRPSSSHEPTRHYMNDPPYPAHSNKPEVAFTVTDNDGKGLKFTIAKSGIHIHFPQDNFSSRDEKELMTSPRHYANRELFDQLPSTSVNPWYNNPGHRNHIKMTPNLTASGNTNTEAMGATLKKDLKDMKIDRKQESVITSRDMPIELPKPLRSNSDQRQTPKTTASPPKTSNEVNDIYRLRNVCDTVTECSWYWGAMSGSEAKNVLRDTEPGTFLLRDSSDPKHLYSLSVKTKQGPTSIRIVYSNGTFRFDSEMDDTNAQRRAQQQQHARNGTVDLSHQGHPNYVKKMTPVFTCVVKMVLHYTRHLGYNTPKPKSKPDHCPNCHASLTEESGESTQREPDQSRPEQFMCYWVDRGARQEIPVLLSTPLSKKPSFPSLQNLCRRSLSISMKLWDNEDKIDQFMLPNKLKKYIKKYPYPV